jgi:hypothetical protein
VFPLQKRVTEEKSKYYLACQRPKLPNSPCTQERGNNNNNMSVTSIMCRSMGVIFGIAIVSLIALIVQVSFRSSLSLRINTNFKNNNASAVAPATVIVHMVAVADANFAKKYRPIFEKNQQYADFHNYKWHVIGTESKNCSELYKDFFFRKHCMVAEWMENSINKDDVVVVFDSDVVPYRSNESLQNWTSNSEDIVLYERMWNTEIAAGNYIARNNPRARSFLREWSKFEYEVPPPPAFHSSDNGKP